MYPDSQNQHNGWASLDEKYEVMKEIGDGSFGSVSLARVRTAGAHVARRGTLVSFLHSSPLHDHILSVEGRDQDDEEDV